MTKQTQRIEPQTDTPPSSIVQGWLIRATPDGGIVILAPEGREIDILSLEMKNNKRTLEVRAKK